MYKEAFKALGPLGLSKVAHRGWHHGLRINTSAQAFEVKPPEAFTDGRPRSSQSHKGLSKVELLQLL